MSSLRAAKMLHDAYRARSAVSRAYFAAYSAVMSQLPAGMTFIGGRPNPPHGTLHDVVKHNLQVLKDDWKQKQAVRIIRMLRANRIASDYDDKTTVDLATSLESVREAARFLDLLEVR